MRPRDNPFAVERWQRFAAYRLRDTTWETLLQRFAALRHRAAIVGPEGHGKTTLQQTLADRLEADGWHVEWVRLTTEKPRLDAADWRTVAAAAGGLLCLDGAEQLTRHRWYRLRWRSRRCRGLLVTTHRPGLLPTLHICRTTPELLRECIAELLAGTGMALDVDAATLHRRHDGNVREALRELYDRCAVDSGRQLNRPGGGGGG